MLTQPPDGPDEGPVEAFFAGDDGALVGLYREYGLRLRRLFCRWGAGYGDSPQAEDLVQDVFSRLLQMRRDGLHYTSQGPGAFWGLLQRIAKFIWGAEVRRCRTRRAHGMPTPAGQRGLSTPVDRDETPSDSHEVTARGPEPVEAAANSETSVLVWEALGTLPFREKACMALWLLGKTLQETAASLEISVSSAFRCLEKAKQQVAERLSKKGVK